MGLSLAASSVNSGSKLSNERLDLCKVKKICKRFASYLKHSFQNKNNFIRKSALTLLIGTFALFWIKRESSIPLENYTFSVM